MNRLELLCTLLVLALGGCALLAVFSRNLIRAAVALGGSSVVLAVLFFLLGAPYAGGFELSVGAGLLSVLFIITISLIESSRTSPSPYAEDGNPGQ
ncbi:MAG: Na(+)/H(+) antiporter subunit B [Anaerolineales bacterium]